MVGWISRSVIDAALVGLLASVTGCGGGGGGGGVAPGQQSVILSGFVSAPSGLVTLDRQDSPAVQLAQFLVGSAHADAMRLSPVPDGTLVALARIDRAGTIQNTISQTTTHSGRYEFNLTKLDLAFASDLVALVRSNSTGASMRAIVAAPQADISPESEAAVQLIVEQLQASGAGFEKISITEATDLQQSVENLADEETSTLGGIDARVASIKARVRSSDSVRQFLADVSLPGEAPYNLGDLGEYFPLKSQSVHHYVEKSNALPAPKHAIYLTGTRTINGVTAFEKLLPSGGKQYLVKDTSGIYLVAVEDQFAGLTFLPQRVPILRFPLRIGATVTLYDKATKIADLDGDGSDENRVTLITATVRERRSLLLAGRQVERCLDVFTVVRDRVTLSRSKRVATDIVEESSWYAPRIGLVRQDLSETFTFNGQTNRGAFAMELGGVAFVDKVSLNATDLAYDPSRKRIYATVLAGGQAPQNGLSIIDATSGAIERTIPITDGVPILLALSADAKVLYLGLEGSEGIIQKYDVDTMSVVSEIQMGKQEFGLPPDNIYLPVDIEVNPQDSNIIAVTRRLGTLLLPTSLFVNGKEIRPAGFGSGPEDVTFAPDGASLEANEYGISITDIYLPGVLGRKRSNFLLGPPPPTFYTTGKGVDNQVYIRNGRAFSQDGSILELASNTRSQFSIPDSSFPPFEIPSPAIIERDIDRDGFFYLTGSQLHYIDETLAREVGVPVDLKPLGYVEATGFNRPRKRMIRYGRNGIAMAGLSETVALVRAPLWAVGEVTLPVVPAPAYKLEVNSIDLDVRYLATDPVHNLIYASIIAPIGAAGGRIAVIDPTGPEVLRYIAVSSPPNILAISNDGSYLYAGLDQESAIQRIVLATETPDLRIPLTDSGCSRGTATDVEVLPDSPTSIAVVSRPNLGLICPVYRAVLGIYDNGVARTKKITKDLPGGPESIEFGASASLLFESAEFSPHITDFAVSASGVTLSANFDGVGFQSFKYFNDKLYSSAGKAHDAVTKLETRTYVDEFGRSGGLVELSPTAATIYFFNRDNSVSSVITEFDLASGRYLERFDISLGSDYYPFVREGELTSWGERNLAYIPNSPGTRIEFVRRIH